MHACTHLAVGNGNDVGGDVGGHITGLSLNDGEGSEGAATDRLVHLGRALQETRVEVEHITGVGLATGGTAKQQGHLCFVVRDRKSVSGEDKRHVCATISEQDKRKNARVLQGESGGGGGGGRSKEKQKNTDWGRKPTAIT